MKTIKEIGMDIWNEIKRDCKEILSDLKGMFKKVDP